MKKYIVVGVFTGLLVGAGIVSYLKKHPDLNNFKAVESSWLSPDEKQSAILRLAGMTCDQAFKKYFIKGTAVLSQDVADMDEQVDSYVLFRDLSIINGPNAFTGKYVCTYYKSGKEPYLMASFDRGASDLLLPKK